MTERQIQFLERLVEDLVDMTRVNTGRLSIVHETVKLQEFLREALDSCAGAAEDSSRSTKACRRCRSRSIRGACCKSC